MIRLSIIVSVLESYEIVRLQLLHFNDIMTSECELILIDDGSQPTLAAICDSVEKAYAFQLHLTHDTRPWTQPRGRNIGARLARADKLLFFDIDNILTQPLIYVCLTFQGDKLLKSSACIALSPCRCRNTSLIFFPRSGFITGFRPVFPVENVPR